MADEPDDEDLGSLAVETETVTDWFEVKDGFIIAPRGWADVQDHFGSPLIRVRMETASVEVLMSDDDGVTWKWRNVEKLKVSAEIREIKSK
ncbi:MAG: hypothetical protein KGL35_00875 [Bradyrhizobium sp.]|nr:hypothetical protein [Bradyrhizobium sp.]